MEEERKASLDHLSPRGLVGFVKAWVAASARGAPCSRAAPEVGGGERMRRSPCQAVGGWAAASAKGAPAVSLHAVRWSSVLTPLASNSRCSRLSYELEQWNERAVQRPRFRDCFGSSV